MIFQTLLFRLDFVVCLIFCFVFLFFCFCFCFVFCFFLCFVLFCFVLDFILVFWGRCFYGFFCCCCFLFVLVFFFFFVKFFQRFHHFISMALIGIFRRGGGYELFIFLLLFFLFLFFFRIVFPKISSFYFNGTYWLEQNLFFNVFSGVHEPLLFFHLLMQISLSCGKIRLNQNTVQKIYDCWSKLHTRPYKQNFL